MNDFLSKVFAAVRPSGGLWDAKPPTPPPPGQVNQPKVGITREEEAAELRGRVVRPQKTLHRFEETVGRAPATHDSFMAVVRKSGPELASVSTRKRLSEIVTELRNLDTAIGQVTDIAARKLAKSQLAKLAKQAASGEVSKIADVDVWSRQELGVEFQQKRAVLKQRRREIRAEVAALIEPIAVILEKVATALADKWEAEERQRCAEAGCKFVPSISTAVMGQLGSGRVREFLPTYAAPSELLALLEPPK